MTHIARYAPCLSGWPAKLSLRIAVLSDIHACTPFMDADRLSGICEEVNGLAPDLILLLGDYAPGPRFSQPLAPERWGGALARLSAPLGVHAVLGNHDYERHPGRLSQQATAAETALVAAGIAVYINRAVRIAAGEHGFWLAGLGDQYAFMPKGSRDYVRGRGVDDLDATLAQVITDEPIILMAHEPDLFPDTPDRVALTLSGHTHGGQVKLFGRTPVVPSRHGSRYVHGQFSEGSKQLIVSAGLGYSGLPLRLGTRPELVVIELGDKRP